MNSSNEQPSPKSSFVPRRRYFPTPPRYKPPMTYTGAYPPYPITGFQGIHTIQTNPGYRMKGLNEHPPSLGSMPLPPGEVTPNLYNIPHHLLTPPHIYPPPMTHSSGYPLYPVTGFPIRHPGCDSFHQTAKLQKDFIQQSKYEKFESRSNRGYPSPDESISNNPSGSASNGRERRSHFSSPNIAVSKRKSLLDKWLLNKCSPTSETKDPPVNLYYEQDHKNENVLQGTSKLLTLCEEFEHVLVNRGKRALANKHPQPTYERRNIRRCKCCRPHNDSDSSTESGEDTNEEDRLMEELERKNNHPDRLHPELWYNDPGEMNDGPLCRCSAKAKKSGIHNAIFLEELSVYSCDNYSNNADKLYHYKIAVSPSTDFLTQSPTLIMHDQHKYIFEGFSMFSHEPLQNLPECKFIRNNTEYKLFFIEDKLPEHFIIRELNLFHEFLFKELLELVDFDFKVAGNAEGCSLFHFMPRFVRESETGKELLSMNEVLIHLLNSSKPLFPLHNLYKTVNLPEYKWQSIVDQVKGMVVTYPGKKPCSLRVDQLNKDQTKAKKGEIKVPEIVHFCIRPSQLSFNGNPEYEKTCKQYNKFHHLKANMSKSSFKDKRKLKSMKKYLKNMKTPNNINRSVTVAISGDGFYKTGIMCDVVQHAMLIPVLVSHLTFHKLLDVIYNKTEYACKNRNFLHPSYCEQMNPDHVRNSLSNCGIRQPEYGELYETTFGN